MRDWHSLSYIVRNKDYIFNLAGQVSHQDSMTDPLMDMEINVKAQLVLPEAAGVGVITPVLSSFMPAPDSSTLSSILAGR